MNSTETLDSQPRLVEGASQTESGGLKYENVNESVVVRDDVDAEWRVILVSGIVFLSYPQGDKHSDRLACVRLRLDGFAQQREIVRVFG